MHLVYPLKFCNSILFDFSWDDCNTQEKLETMVMQIWRAGGKQDALWSMWKLWMNGKCKKWQQHIPFFFTCFFFFTDFRGFVRRRSPILAHAPPSSLPNKSSSYGRYIRSINSSQQGQLISKQNVMSQLAAVQHKFFNSNMGALFFCHFPLQSTHTGPRAQNDLTF